MLKNRLGGGGRGAPGLWISTLRQSVTDGRLQVWTFSSSSSSSEGGRETVPCCRSQVKHEPTDGTSVLSKHPTSLSCSMFCLLCTVLSFPVHHLTLFEMIKNKKQTNIRTSVQLRFYHFCPRPVTQRLGHGHQTQNNKQLNSL